MPPLLDVKDLRVQFETRRGLVKAVDGVSLSVEAGTTLGVVGESGSGKSAMSLALMGLHRQKNATVSGEVWLDGQQLVGQDDATWRNVRGQKVAMIFQDPMSALHPQHRVSDQVSEAYRINESCSRREARAKAVEMLDLVRIPRAKARANDYPHQFSGGMRQRVVIAMALCCQPDLLVADEPTTALDVTIQAEVLNLLRDLQSELRMGIILITHDLGVVAEMADNVMVMYAGRAVERSSADRLFNAPEHPYTWGLMGSLVHLDRPTPERLLAIPGSPPSLVDVPHGCPFHVRCRYAAEVGPRCETDRPELRTVAADHRTACHLDEKQRRAARTVVTAPATDIPAIDMPPETPPL
jgi:peptide/nickel transport system ATP-binding protein